LPSGVGHPTPWWSLTPPFHPYPAETGRSALCCTGPRVAPGGCYPPSLLCGARTFLSRCRPRPSGDLSSNTPFYLLSAGASHPGAHVRAGSRPNVTKLIHLPDRPCRYALIRWMGEDPVAALRGQDTCSDRPHSRPRRPFGTGAGQSARTSPGRAEEGLEATGRPRTPRRRRLAGRGRRTQHRPRYDRQRTGVAHLLRRPVRGHGRLRARRRCRRGRVSARAPASGPRLLRPVRPRGRPRSHPRLPAGDEDGTGRPGSAHIVLETDSGRILAPLPPRGGPRLPLERLPIGLAPPEPPGADRRGRYDQGRQAPRGLPLGEVLPWAVRRTAARRRTSAAGEQRRTGVSGPGVLRRRVQPAHCIEAGIPDDRARGLKEFSRGAAAQPRTP